MTNYFSHSPLVNAIFRHASEHSDKTALISTEGLPISYASLWLNIGRAAAWLSDAGVKSGDRIILSALKEVEFIYLYFGAHILGAVNVVVDAKNNKDHLGYIASTVRPALAVGAVLDGILSFRYTDISLPENPVYGSPLNLKHDDPADIMFTSGTTGHPKGVVLSHFNIASSASNINSFIRNTAGDVELLGLPVCHSFGLGRLRCNMLLGATVVLHDGFANLKSVFDAFEKYHVTGFGMVPAVWAYTRRFSGSRIGRFASQIRYIEIGSAAMSVEDKILLSNIFPDTRICMHYGLTEASRAVFMEFHESADDLASAGKAVCDMVDVRLLADGVLTSRPGVEGEVCVRGNMVTRSYFLANDNAGAFIDGYFRTGDWGIFSSGGNLRLIARKKELINVGGKKVSPVEIEDALESIGVGESMCVAIPDPAGILGEIPKAMLVKGSFSLTIDEIRSRLRDKLETYKLPAVYEVVDSLPKTANGKKIRTHHVETDDK